MSQKHFDVPAVTISVEKKQATGQFLADVLIGLSRTQKSIPSKYFYDEKGSQLFDQICDLDEYYPTRTEIRIMQQHIDEMVEVLGPEVLLVEYGSGSSLKTRILLQEMDQLAGYVPIDISKEHLYQSAAQIKNDFPGLKVYPVHADYSAEFTVPLDIASYGRKVVYFPGSTIGNFNLMEAEAFLKRIGRVVGKGGGLLIGVDLRKDVEILEAAYNDRQQVTAEFNLNLLERINRELDANFNLACFEHKAIFNEKEGRIEMHLVSKIDQQVTIGEQVFSFKAGESIHTENSYKYTLTQFAALARCADLKVERLWTDANRLFSVQYLTVA